MIKRNKDNLRQLLEQCIDHNARLLKADRNLRIQNRIADEERIFQLDFLKSPGKLERYARVSRSQSSQAFCSRQLSVEEILLNRINRHKIRRLKPRDSRELLEKLQQLPSNRPAVSRDGKPRITIK